MTKTFCDRCGKEGRIDSIRLPVIDKSGGKGWIYGPVELCPECCHDLARCVAQKASA